MIRDIVVDEEILEVPCEPATAEDAALADDLVETLIDNGEAAALAANQVGEAKALVVYLNDAGKPVVMYNPKITQKLRPYAAVEECLSHANAVPVERYEWIRVSYDALEGGKLVPRKKKLEGWAAQVVQHMVDHCNGEAV